jgi:hypothetical protein
MVSFRAIFHIPSLTPNAFLFGCSGLKCRFKNPSRCGNAVSSDLLTPHHEAFRFLGLARNMEYCPEKAITLNDTVIGNITDSVPDPKAFQIHEQ